MASLAKQTTQIIMSETPRTDARVFDADLVSASFARELERDLARKEISRSRNNELMYAMARENARLRRCVQHLIDNGYTAGTDGQTPDELCDYLLPEEWPSCLPLPKIAHTSRSE